MERASVGFYCPMPRAGRYGKANLPLQPKVNVPRLFAQALDDMLGYPRGRRRLLDIILKDFIDRCGLHPTEIAPFQYENPYSKPLSHYDDSLDYILEDRGYEESRLALPEDADRFFRPAPDTGGPVCCVFHRLAWLPDTRWSDSESLERMKRPVDIDGGRVVGAHAFVLNQWPNKKDKFSDHYSINPKDKNILLPKLYDFMRDEFDPAITNLKRLAPEERPPYQKAFNSNERIKRFEDVGISHSKLIEAKLAAYRGDDEPLRELHRIQNSRRHRDYRFRPTGPGLHPDDRGVLRVERWETP